MSRPDEEHMRGAERAGDADRILWRHASALDSPEDDAARWLDLAALAEGRPGALDEEERARLEALIAAHPAAAEDVAAARRLAAVAAALPDVDERIVACALSLVPEAGNVVAFPAPARRRRVLSGRVLPDLARWTSLAAAMALASWLGFAMGSGASLGYAQLSQPSPPSQDSLLPDLLDPSTGFLLHDLGEGGQT